MKIVLTTRDHMMVGITACMLFVCYKMFASAPLFAFFLTWFNMSLFNSYCIKRRDDSTH